MLRLFGQKCGNEMNKKETKAFWKQAQENHDEVQKWPLWKRQIVINAKTISSGQFRDRSIK